MDIILELKARNVINNITNDDKAKLFSKTKNVGVYCGFDPSFKSLHLGNYLMLITLKRFANAGYKVVPLVGGATGQIGDPSGKLAERKLLGINVIQNNINEINKQIKAIVGTNCINNMDFYKNMNIFDFLREVGKEINVNYLLEKEIIAKRLEVGISYAEFSYTLIQAFDFYCLYKDYGVVLQIGGSDQWGNITTGIEFIRKKTNDKSNVFGITLNLLTKSDGTKFGKSEKGAIFLNKELTSPYTMYQFLINQTDNDVKKLLLSLTFLSINEIDKIMEKHNENKSVRYAQTILAKSIVSDIHGKRICEKCEQISKLFFANDLSKLNANDLLMVLNDMPTTNIDTESINILDLLIKSNICTSKSQARQLVMSKSIYINNKLVDNINININKKEAINNKFSYICKGKKNYFLINWK